MHACPSSDELQNFLDQALDADYVARILAHVEDCFLCQQSLERLTLGGSAIREGLPPARRRDRPRCRRLTWLRTESRHPGGSAIAGGSETTSSRRGGHRCDRGRLEAGEPPIRIRA